MFCILCELQCLGGGEDPRSCLHWREQQQRELSGSQPTAAAWGLNRRAATATLQPFCCLPGSPRVDIEEEIAWNVKVKRKHGIAGGIGSVRKRRIGIKCMWRSAEEKGLVVLLVQFNFFGTMSVEESNLCWGVLLSILLFSVKWSFKLSLLCWLGVGEWCRISYWDAFCLCGAFLIPRREGADETALVLCTIIVVTMASV